MPRTAERHERQSPKITSVKFLGGDEIPALAFTFVAAERDDPVLIAKSQLLSVDRRQLLERISVNP